MWTKIAEGAGGSHGRRAGAWWSDRASSAVASAILDVMRIAVMQDKAVVGDVDANLAIIDRRAGEAAARRADVLVTPELFVTGYAPKRLHAGDPTQQTDIAGALAATAARHGIAVLASYPEVATADTPATRGGGAPGETARHREPTLLDAQAAQRVASTLRDVEAARHIAATLFDTDGRPILHYRKVNLFDDDEAAAFSSGTDAPTTVELAGMRVSVIICFDVEYPEMTRAAALAGADVILAPTALTAGFDDVPEVLVRARALENGVGLAYANHVGVEDGLTFGGGSVIVGPDGGLLAQGGDGAELLVADITRDDVAAARDAVPYLAKLRRDTYASWR